MRDPDSPSSVPACPEREAAACLVPRFGTEKRHHGAAPPGPAGAAAAAPGTGSVLPAVTIVGACVPMHSHPEKKYLYPAATGLIENKLL